MERGKGKRRGDAEEMPGNTKKSRRFNVTIEEPGKLAIVSPDEK